MNTRAQPDPERNSPPAAVDIVIVNWNAGALLRTCLGALAGSENASRVNVIVVDNASTDGSAQHLETSPLRVHAICNSKNRGFAAACNQGAAAGRAPLILFLNPDARVERNTIAQADAFLAEPANAAVGILGIRLLDDEGNTSRSCARRPTVAAMLLRTMFLDRLFPNLVPPHFMSEWNHLDTRAVDQVMGAFLMIRRDLFTGGGGFDERFFVYYEDLDLCLRAIDSGHTVVHFANATAVHDVGGTTTAVKDRRLFYEMTSRVLFMHKWHGTVAACALIALISLVEIPLRALGQSARSPQQGWLVLRGAMMFWRNLQHLLHSVLAARPR